MVKLIAIPSACKMPDLSALNSLMPLLLVQVMIGDPGLSRKAALYRRNFIRLVDKAVDEYGEARNYILQQIEESKRPAKELEKHGRQLYILEFTNHIETCINAISRLYRILERIKAEKKSSFIPRELRKLVETKFQLITNLRNSIEHIDEMIQCGEISEGNPIMLALCEDNETIAVANCTIKFEDLALVLKSLHEIAQHILSTKKNE